MASTEVASQPHDRHGRRRPFSNWMKRLANLKNSNSDHDGHISHKRSDNSHNLKTKKGNTTKNNPYPISGRIETLARPPSNGHLSFSTPISSRYTASSVSRSSLPDSHDEAVQNGARSAAPTVSTSGETPTSDAISKAGTSATAAKTDGGRDSTFSSPAPSIRSLTTTLTTVHSAVTSNQNQAATGGQQSSSGGLPSGSYSHPFTSSPPPSAVPQHLAPHNHPITYHAAIANNALTDDASILTLASSTKRRRRNSLDTNASIRALAPQSVWGGSRESLPLSVLSGPEPSGSIYNAQGAVPRPSIGGLASAERASVYSSSGVVPAMPSERNSYIAKPSGGDGASVRSGRHGRGDSLSNITGPNLGKDSPSTIPTSGASASMPGPGRLSRRGSGWGEVTGAEADEGADARSESGVSRDDTHE